MGAPPRPPAVWGTSKGLHAYTGIQRACRPVAAATPAVGGCSQGARAGGEALAFTAPARMRARPT